MIFSVIVDDRRVKLDLDPIPKSLFELNESLEKLYPNHIDYTEWPKMGAPNERLHRLDGPKHPLRYFATYSSDRVNNRNILKQDLQLWQLDSQFPRCNSNAPAAPTLLELELDPTPLPKLLSAKKLAVSLPDDKKTIKLVDFNRRTSAYDVIVAAVKGTAFSPDEMTLSDAPGRQLPPTASLVADYNILPGSSLIVKKEKAGSSFVVFVKTLRNNTITLVANSGLDIHDLKMQIQKSEGIPPDHQRLIYAGSQLEDGFSVGRYNIGREATLHLVKRLRGGMLHETSGRLDFTNMAVFEDSSSTGDIEVQVVLPDLSVLVLHMDENNFSFEKVKENVVKMIRQRANKRAAEELVAVDVDAETDVGALRSMLRKLQLQLQRK